MINRETVLHISNLAKIEIREDEIEKFINEFRKIIDFFNQLDEIEFNADVEPTYHVLPLKNVMREDEPKKSLDREEILKNARHRENGYFKGPKVVE